MPSPPRASRPLRGPRPHPLRDRRARWALLVRPQASHLC
nr:MAG: hypothetical protein [Molluscum contagiosum virus]